MKPEGRKLVNEGAQDRDPPHSTQHTAPYIARLGLWSHSQLRIGMGLHQWRDCRLQQLIDQIDNRGRAQGALFDGQIAGHLDHVYANLKCEQTRDCRLR